MNRKKIIVNSRDYTKLTGIIDGKPGSSETEYRELYEELKNAVLVEPDEMPADVITMNSKVRFKDIEESEDYIFSLVYPEDADTSKGKLSILAPIGTALLGYRVGDEVKWKVPAGLKTFLVEEILYQPEANRDYHL
ncbi:MAG TPA: nucleoside diphosphate kinase regulator [Spirochaetota bacterium]|nr:nucleoside diphosphate kinase regulator [Spirochaetota bacterium]HPF07639.1 nucleoside diphosphate kinase regulator [Spirochaetota bacterium]HRX49235.1 nucleoside diphosphate kinase regulator [Spirochaetota bacterium]